MGVQRRQGVLHRLVVFGHGAVQHIIVTAVQQMQTLQFPLVHRAGAGVAVHGGGRGRHIDGFDGKLIPVQAAQSHHAQQTVPGADISVAAVVQHFGAHILHIRTDMGDGVVAAAQLGRQRCFELGGNAGKLKAAGQRGHGIGLGGDGCLHRVEIQRQ